MEQTILQTEKMNNYSYLTYFLSWVSSKIKVRIREKEKLGFDLAFCKTNSKLLLCLIQWEVTIFL